ARRRGGRFVAVDPYRSRTAEKADAHLALLPGTDAALALGVMHVVFRDRLEDRDYIEKYTSGVEALEARAREWPPERVAAVTALFVYHSNPAAVAPEQDQVHRGLAREDLFVVVHDLFLTDTADFADVVLPATTTLEHYDIHKAYGHLHLSLSRAAIAPLGESKPNTEVFRLLARRMGLAHPCLSESDEQMARHALVWEHPHLR